MTDEELDQGMIALNHFGRVVGGPSLEEVSAARESDDEAFVVDTTLQPVPGGGNPLAYFSQDQIEERGDEDTQARQNE